MKRKLSKSNVSSHEINSFHEIHAFACIQWDHSTVVDEDAKI